MRKKNTGEQRPLTGPFFISLSPIQPGSCPVQCGGRVKPVSYRVLWFWNNKTPFCPNSIRAKREQARERVTAMQFHNCRLAAPYTYPRGSQCRPGMFALPLHQTGYNAFHMWEKKGREWRVEERKKGVEGGLWKSGRGQTRAMKRRRR